MTRVDDGRQAAGPSEVERQVPGPPDRLLDPVRQLSRWPEWLALHRRWRAEPPGEAVAGLQFVEQVALMGIPADVTWTVTGAGGDDDVVAVTGVGPMGLELGLELSARPDGTGGSLLRCRFGLRGGPADGPVGAALASAVEEALGASLTALAVLADPPDPALPVEPVASDGPASVEPVAPVEPAVVAHDASPVLHRATGTLLDPHTPVLVGAGQVVRRAPEIAAEIAADPAGAPPDPVALAVRALRRAADDSGAGEALLRAADAVYAVSSTSWTYRDEAALVAAAVGATPAETVRSARFGGDGAQRLVAAAAEAVAEGRHRVALVCGAEAGASLAAVRRTGRTPDWPTQSADVAPTRVVGDGDRPANHDAETAVGLVAPVHFYALLEFALAGRAQAGPQQQSATAGALWSRFSAVAATNPYAWLAREHTVAELVGTGPDNRPVCAPYPKLLCANLQVDLASGLIVTSVAAAEAAGVPQDRWVFPHVAASGQDRWFVSERADLAASPAIRALGRAVLDHAGLSIEDVGPVDLYGCFPSAVQIAAAELGLPVDDPARPLTVTGGLTFAGGPGNNYGGHAVATLVARLRAEPAAYGLATSVGWYLTKHAVGLYSATPPARPFQALRPQVEQPPARPVRLVHTGPAVLEAFTIPYGRNGSPEAAILSLLVADGARVLLRTRQPDVLAALLDGVPTGCAVLLTEVGAILLGGPQRHPLPPPPVEPHPVAVPSDAPSDVAADVAVGDGR